MQRGCSNFSGLPSSSWMSGIHTYPACTCPGGLSVSFIASSSQHHISCPGYLRVPWNIRWADCQQIRLIKCWQMNIPCWHTRNLQLQSLRYTLIRKTMPKLTFTAWQQGLWSWKRGCRQQGWIWNSAVLPHSPPCAAPSVLEQASLQYLAWPVLDPGHTQQHPTRK